MRHQEDVILVPVDQIATIQADGEVLRITTTRMERFTLTERLRDVEARLDPALFIRLSRSLIANLEMVQRVSPVAGGLLQLTLSNGMRLGVSRLRARALREQLTRI